MKNRLKTTLCILIIALISIIAFVGIYTNDGVFYKESLPGYLLDSELKGKRVSYLKISEDTEEKIYDKNGNEVDSIPEGEEEANYKKETVKVNLDEKRTEENFKTVKEIFNGRLTEIGAEDFSVRLDKETGNVVVELADDENTDTFLQYLLFNGDFAIVDSEDETVLLDRNDVTKASVVYGNTSAGEVTVYLDIKFTDDGAKKLEELSKKYIKVEDEEAQKSVSLKVEGSTLMTTYFGEEITSGELTISMGSANNNETLYNYAKQAGIIAMIINNGELPLSYKVSVSELVESEINETLVQTIIIILAALVSIIIIYMIIKYKADGIYAGLSFVSAIAILLLLLRYTNTAISLGGFASMFILILIESYFMLTILNSIKNDNSLENTKNINVQVYKNKKEILITLLIIAIVFTFMKEVKIYSIGMTLFYGMISLAISNLVFLKTMLVEGHNK